jgi:hypothetical protein
MAEERKVVRSGDSEQRGGYLSGPKPETGAPPKPRLFTTPQPDQAPASPTTSQQSSPGSGQKD